MAGEGHRIVIELEGELAVRLSNLAAEQHIDEAEFARSVLDEATRFEEIDGHRMTEILNAIPGALEQAKLGWEQYRAGDFVPLSEL